MASTAELQRNKMMGSTEEQLQGRPFCCTTDNLKKTHEGHSEPCALRTAFDVHYSSSPTALQTVFLEREPYFVPMILKKMPLWL